jgi:hypothetical protein
LPDSLDFDPFDRMLLTADGTVTSLLEACTGEPITTRTTRQAGAVTLDRLLTITGGWWHPDAGLVELAPVGRVKPPIISTSGRARRWRAARTVPPVSPPTT